MDIKKIEEILQTSYTKEDARQRILEEVANDENAIPDILAILGSERAKNRKVITEMNMQLSRALLYVQFPEVCEKEFIIQEGTQFYEKHKGSVEPLYDVSKLDKP